MPHSGRIIRAHRQRRIVKRREQISPYVSDLRGRLAQAVDDVPDVFGVKLPVSLLDSARWKNVSADTHGRRSAAKRINDQLQQAVHIVIRIAFL